MNIIKYFLMAIVTFTRIPMPQFELCQKDIGKCMMFFPLMGSMIGLVCGGVWWFTKDSIPHDILLLLMVLLPAMITGAYHEDGFADVCDAYGGYDRKTMRTIMKDSRVGTFGTLGLVTLFSLKLLLLREISFSIIPIAIVSAMTLGRLCIMPVSKWQHHLLRKKSRLKKSITTDILNFGWTHFIVAAVIGIAVTSTVVGIRNVIFLFGITQLTVILAGIYFRRKFGVITGDVSGAIEQIGEVTVYCSFAFGILS